MPKQSLITLLVGSMLLVLAACASDPEDSPTEEKMEQVVAEPEAVTQAVVENEVEEEPEPEMPMLDQNLLGIKTFYFDYDQSDLRNIALTALDTHAENILNKLTTSPGMRILVEGHADERGTIAYNNALGNRRAEAVARYLRVKGVPGGNLDVISYGELRPLSDEHTAAAMQLNRRAVITY